MEAIKTNDTYTLFFNEKKNTYGVDIDFMGHFTGAKMTFEEADALYEAAALMDDLNALPIPKAVTACLRKSRKQGLEGMDLINAFADLWG